MNKLIYFIVFVLIVVVLIDILKNKFNIKDKAFQKFPYKKRNIMTESELSFFRKLENEYKDKYYIIPQVLLSSIIDVDLPRNFYAYKGYRSKMDKKTIDFVLFEKETFKPFIAIELDDSSHLRKDRQGRDEFVNELFEKAGVKLQRKVL